MTVNNSGIIQSTRVNGSRAISIGDGGVNTRTEPQKAAPKGKWQQLLSGISNRSCSFSTTVKKVFVGIGDVFKGITAKWGKDASTPSRMPMQKASANDGMACKMDPLVAMVYHERANIVTAKSILSPLFNDGKSNSSASSIDSDEKMISDYLLKNPTSHLFSSDNIRCQGDYIYFNKPISLVRQGNDLLFITNPMEGRAISKVKIDTRPGTNGEFRGETAMKVLQDKTLTFTSLADLCQKMTANPQRNISAMMTGNTLKTFFNGDKAQAKILLSGEHAERFKAFVSVDAYGHYVSKYPVSDLTRPTTWPGNERDSTPNVSDAPAVQRPASSRAALNNLSATRRTISPWPGHLSAMTKRFEAQSSITDNASVQHDSPNRKRVISPAIQALQDKLAVNINQNKPLGGGIRQR